MVISLKDPAVPCHSRSKTRQKFIQMDGDVVIWGELVHWEQAVKSAQIFQHKVAKLFGMCDGNRPPSSNLGCSDKIAKVRK